jgi:UDPglucose--hexose-1-phosphate uridylyltransferase
MKYDRDDATTSEMRHDWLADRWVIIAPQRTERPNDFVRRQTIVNDDQHCPFCFGHEDCTPEAVASYQSARGNGKWKVRVVPNKFPAVNASMKSLDSASAMIANGTAQYPNADNNGDAIDLFRRRELKGGHEVIVESPLHLQSISQLDRETTRLVFTAYRDRLRYWLEDRRLTYAVVFKNVGQDAGASLSHTHSQLIATDLLPTDIQRTVQRMKLFFSKESTCLLCRMAEDELEQKLRVVEQTPEFLAFCPFASRLPSLITIIPKVHQSEFELLDDSQLEQLSWLTHRLVRRIERCYPDAAYNFIIHTAPSCQKRSDSFHWRLELFPRITKVAGFEWGSDCYINPLAPESAAAALRKAGV